MIDTNVVLSNMEPVKARHRLASGTATTAARTYHVGIGFNAQGTPDTVFVGLSSPATDWPTRVGLALRKGSKGHEIATLGKSK